MTGRVSPGLSRAPFAADEQLLHVSLHARRCLAALSIQAVQGVSTTRPIDAAGFQVFERLVACSSGRVAIGICGMAPVRREPAIREFSEIAGIIALDRRPPSWA